MPNDKPFFRTYRPNNNEHDNLYMHDKRYIEHPSSIIKMVEILYEDLDSIYQYVEPSDCNSCAYSLRIFKLLVQICIEIESHFKGILSSNGYSKDSNLNMNDYSKVNKTHHLSSYEVIIPFWRGSGRYRKPFRAWENEKHQKLPWHGAYNDVKHNREEQFHSANLHCVTDAFCGLLVLLASQFHDIEFADENLSFILGDNILSDGFEGAIGAPFRIKFPDDWEEEEKYSFKWKDIENDPKPFNSLKFK